MKEYMTIQDNTASINNCVDKLNESSKEGWIIKHISEASRPMSPNGFKDITFLMEREKS